MAKTLFPDNSASPAFLKDALPVGSFATSWLHFLSPLPENRILQGKGERGTARERQSGCREKRQMRGVFVPPAVSQRAIYHREKDVASSTPSWPFTTHPNIHIFSRSHKSQISCTMRKQASLSLQWKPRTKAHTQFLCIVAPTPAVSFWSLSLSINYSISCFQHRHPSCLPLFSIHPSFLLSPSFYLSFHPSALTVVVFWQGHGHRLAHTSLLSAAALNGLMIWFLVLSFVGVYLWRLIILLWLCCLLTVLLV